MNTFTMNRFAIALPFSLLLGLSAFGQSKNIAINNDGAAPDPSGTAILDVQSNYVGIQKGMFIPRVTISQKTTLTAGLNATHDGLTVYQADLGAPALDGFYYWDGATLAWLRCAKGANAWDLAGNDLNNGNPAADFFGTTDNQSVAFRTNAVERMRLTNTGNLGVNTTTPQEKLDILGALRIYPSGALFSATNSQGTIRFQRNTPAPDTLFSTAFAPFAAQALLWSGHWGNINGVAPTTAGINPLPGGWRRLENDYDEIFNAAYTQQGQATCSSGAVNIPNAAVPALMSNALTAAQQEMVSPYLHNAIAKRWRHQHMWLASEVNVEVSQLSGNTTQTGGLCPGQAIDSIAFWINTPVAAAQQKLWQYQVLIKHAPLGVNDLSTGFDNSIDGAGVCVANAGGTAKPNANVAAGWNWFKFSGPFVWDGVRNIIVEIAVSSGNATNLPLPLPVGYMAVPGVAPANQLTYSVVAGSPYIGACAPAAATACAVSLVAPFIPSTGCGTVGSINFRPVIRFAGGITTAPAATSGNGNYLLYKGGFISEASTAPFAWGRWIVNNPVGQAYRVYKGPGIIAAENGVYDNGVRLNDHVFDRAFDGKVKPADAPDFGDGRNLNIEEMADYARENRHLPTVRGRDDWNREGGFSLGEMTNQLWATAETQALYMTDLNDRLNVLEMLSTDRPLSADDLVVARKAVVVMGDLTEQEKASLLNDLKARTTHTNENH